MRGVLYVIWGLYALAFAALALTVDADWLTPVLPYTQSLAWMAPDSLAARAASLVHAGRLAEAQGFLSLGHLSLGVLLVAFATGLIAAAWSDHPQDLRPRETRYVMALLALVLITASTTNGWLAGLEHINVEAQPRFAGSPAYWLATMGLSTAFIARYLALGTHDLAALVIRTSERGALSLRWPLRAETSADSPPISPAQGRTAAE